MIEIQRPEQFTRAAERLMRERMHVSRHEPGLYRVVNQEKFNTYHVRITRRSGKTFGKCTCEAGTPSRGRDRLPLVCKHLAAVVIYLRAVSRMRRGH